MPMMPADADDVVAGAGDDESLEAVTAAIGGGGDGAWARRAMQQG